MMEWCSVILSLVAFLTGIVSLSTPSCSPLVDGNFYRFPNFSLDNSGNVARFTGLEESKAGYSYIYVPGERNCSGIASAVKYCYSFSRYLSKFFHYEATHIFTLSVLEISPASRTPEFTVRKVFDISSVPALDKCSSWSQIYLCCDTKSLGGDKFEVSRSHFAYMVTLPYPEGSASLLGWSKLEAHNHSVMQYEIPSVTYPIRGRVYIYARPPTLGPHKLVEFHIDRGSPVLTPTVSMVSSSSITNSRSILSSATFHTEITSDSPSSSYSYRTTMTLQSVLTINVISTSLSADFSSKIWPTIEPPQPSQTIAPSVGSTVETTFETSMDSPTGSVSSSIVLLSTITVSSFHMQNSLSFHSSEKNMPLTNIMTTSSDTFKSKSAIVTVSTPTNATVNNSSHDLIILGGVIGSLVVVLLIVLTLVTFVAIFRKSFQTRDHKFGFSNVMYNIINDSDNGLSDTSGSYNHSYESASNYTSPPLQSGRYEMQWDVAGTMDESYGRQEDRYQAPSDRVSTLFEVLTSTTEERITRSSIELGCLIGSGQFAEVYKGVWQRSSGDVEVAVKILKQGVAEMDRVKFLQEGAIMHQFKHPHVVTMYGVVTDEEPVMLVLELLHEGDLRSYLQRARPTELSEHNLMLYCCQIASGMLYLSNKDFIHRDLAARNILVTEHRVCKIADFGMSRDLMNENYYFSSSGGPVPLKWMAPEAVQYKKYSTASDVWSYGVVLYEIWSIGHKPFEGVRNDEVIRLINLRYRLSRPPRCPQTIYKIMLKCW